MKTILGIWILWICLIIAGVVGYIMNIVKTTQCDFTAPNKAVILRVGGCIIPPLGAVEGYLKINK